MIRIKPYRADEWQAIERQGFMKFYLEFIAGSLLVFFLVFSLLDFVLNFSSQSDLMVTGVLSALVFAPTSGIAMWFACRARFRAGKSSGS